MTITWTIEDENILRKLCRENKTIKEITSIIGKSNSSIRNKIKRLYLNFNTLKKEWSEEELKYLKNNYYNGDKHDLIEKINHSWETIKSMAYKLNLKIKDDLNPKIPKNRFLKLIYDTPTSFYWIGFLLADGCISPNLNLLSLEISKKDEQHLDKFIKFLGDGTKTYRRDNVCISNSDKINIPIISKKFDIKNNKTQNPPDLKFYKKFNNDLLFSLLIGFIDGDGSIRKVYSNGFQLTIENHKSWHNFHIMLERFLYRYFDLKEKYINHQRYNIRGYSCLTICNKELLLKIKNKIIEFDLPILNRKWDIITKIKF